MKRALFFVYLVTHFIELSRVARLLRTRGGYECVFLFEHRYPDIGRDLETCRREGFSAIDANGHAIDGLADAPRSRPGLAARLVRVLREATITELCLSIVFPRLAPWAAHYRTELRLAGELIGKLAPTVLVLPEDSVEFATGSLVRAAHARRVPSVIVPFTISNAEESAEARWHDPAFSLDRWRNRMVGRRHPHWVREHRGRKLLALAADRALAMELVGLAPPLPWVVNSGRADAIAAEGPFMRKYYLASGLPPEQIVITGAMYDDMLVERLVSRAVRAAALIRDMGLVEGKPILLCALPPDQSATGRPDAEFKSYDTLLRAWAAALASAQGFNVIVKQHPRTPRADVEFIEREFGLRIAAGDIVDLIPLCDVYVAYASATIRMAIACGIPVLHYDCHRFRYSDYTGVPGVVTSYDIEAFKRSLVQAADPAVREELAARQKRFAGEANILDGRAGERILALVESLVASARHGTDT